MNTVSKAAVHVLLFASVLCGATVDASDPCAGKEGSLVSIAKALEDGRWDDAEAFLHPLEPAQSSCVQVVLDLAHLRAAQGREDEAERLFSRSLTLAPDDAVTHATFARFQISRGFLPQAARLIAQALAIDPECADALVLQGQILGERERYGDARSVLERAVALAPDNADAQHQLGIWFFRVNLFEQASRRFESAIALRPNRTRSYDYLGLCLEMLGDAEGAERAFLEALELQKRGGPFFDVTLEYNYGRFLLKQGRLEESRPYLDRAVDLFPRRRGPRYQRAKLFLAQNNLAAARQDAESALTLGRPGDVVLDMQVYYLLTTIYSRLGESELAREYAQRARDAEIPDQVEDRQR